MINSETAPYFSIVIPTYNRAHLLPGMVRSVQGQDFDNWELLIVDDGSTDTTKHMLGQFKSDARIRYIRQENAGLSSARNKGLAEAKGEIVACIESDEPIRPDFLSMARRESQMQSSRSFAVRNDARHIEFTARN